MEQRDERAVGSSPAGWTLADALAEVARAAPGGAIAQQITRLLGTSPGRAELVHAAIRFRDQLAERYPQLAAVLGDALRRSGVTELRAEGERFDVTRHDAVGTVSAPAADHHDRVAQTVRLGYADAEGVVRLPQVVVGRFESTLEGTEQEVDQ